MQRLFWAASLGSGTAVLFIVGGIFVAGVAAYAIYQQYKELDGGEWIVEARRSRQRAQ